MELRTTQQRQTRQEFKELKTTLTGLGYYEDGMNLLEMQQILNALHQSEDNLMDADMERALRESELDFIHISDGMANSTMITAFTPQRGQQQCSSMTVMRNADSILSDSPELPAQRITVNADVHHPFDWSPPPSDGRRRSPTRQFSLLNDTNNNISAYTTDKKMDLSLTDGRVDVQRNDSGLSLSDGSATSSILTIGSYCTSSSSAHSEFSHCSQDERNQNMPQLSWDDRYIASSSSVAISSDDNQISNADDDSSHPSI